MAEAERPAPDATTMLQNSTFMRACRREPTEYTPIWLMRQAGRYQPEYRAIRDRVSFLELCKTPDLACEVTVMAVDQLGVDAAIIFADILLITEPMGLTLAFEKGHGPTISPAIRSAADIERLPSQIDVSSLRFVSDAISLTRAALKPDIPLIGFCGGPFTVASYMIEGGTSRDFTHAKAMMYDQPRAWHRLLERLVTASAAYLNAQVEAGAQALQVFDSWVGCLDADAYREYVLPHTSRLISEIPADVPVIHFGANTSHLLSAMSEANSAVMGVDFRIGMDRAWELVGPDHAIQGNIDPAILLTSTDQIRHHVRKILDQVGGRPGHVFNLGHGILPNTPVEHAQALVEMVHEYSRK